MGSVLGILAICFMMVFAILAMIFLVVPLLRGIGWAIGGVVTGIGWLVRHVFEFIGGMLTDVVRFVGTIIATIVLVPLSLLNVVIGRWSAAGHFFRSIKREFGVATTCLYRVVLQRPLRFLLLGGLLEGLEERVNEAMEAAPTSDKPRRRTGSFDGYTIVGSLPGGGSGAKLYIAEPDDRKRARNPQMPAQVVIKSFAISDGSSLPQIVRESRALEAAKQLGLVLDHGMDEHRFFYIMPYRRGEHLGLVARQLHGASETSGLGPKRLAEGMGYVQDLLSTLSRYHEGGLWHKDVKPDNIIIQEGRAHLVDLGLVTPLRSAMTLTTHGTEYFRDPEMVRMALRGVKVHQVDGAKFDIYAAGAVLYFVVENTFPAHGGLSNFSKRSPEAVRWIIRRAMTDYNKRYETAELMLADLTYVQNAADPYAVKPADLPSMGGAAPETPEPPQPPREEPEVVVVAAAGSPRPPAAEPRPAPEPQPVAAEPAQASGPDERPKLRVTNWWTGAYEVVDPGGRVGGSGDDYRSEARDFRRAVMGMRHHGADLRRQVRDRAMTARRAAREQIREARTRAREIQRRAREQRRSRVAAIAPPASTAQRQPSAVMAFMALAVIGGLMLLAWGVTRDRDPSYGPVLGMDDPGFVFGSVADGNVFGDDVAGTTLLVINDHPAATNEAVKAEVERILANHRDQGWEVVMNDDTAEVEVRKLLPPGAAAAEAELSPLLRKTLLAHDLGGIILVSSRPGEGEPYERIMAQTLVMPKSSDKPVMRFEVRLPESDDDAKR